MNKPIIKPIMSETDVRKWISSRATSAAVFVEPTVGSTFGTPDYIDWPAPGVTLALELKKGCWSGDGYLRFTVRPAQRHKLLEMKQAGVTCGLLVGIVGEPTMVLLKINETTLSGKVEMCRVHLASFISVGEKVHVAWIASRLGS